MKPFVPMKLPLEFSINGVSRRFSDVDFHNQIVEYTKVITQFNASVKKTKLNRDLLLSGLLKSEALYSTKIEGTQATLTDVFEAEVATKIDKNSDVFEILNYLEAMNAAEYHLSQLAVSTRLFKNLHKLLMSGNVRGKNKDPGEYRGVQNYIGPEGCTINTATFVPPPPNMVDACISDLEKFINSDDALHPVIKTAIFHAQFESIHPFLDGNGRLGRVLIPVCLFYFNEIESVNFFVSEALEKNKYLYYANLNGTRKNTFEAWREWIEFFLDALIEQTKKETDKIGKIDAFYDETLKKVAGIIKNQHMLEIVEFMFKKPIFTAKSVLNEINMNPNTLRGCLNKLEDNKIVASDNGNRNKRYFFYGLINLISQ